MKRYKLLVLLIAWLGVMTASAQRDQKAKEVLDAVAENYEQGNGMKISFKGSQIGTLWLKGECFVLDCGGVKSWFDGKTQWSYVEANGEVNVSSPTPEELQAVNPYALITMYRKGFNYRYDGYKNRKGNKGQEITLLPLVKGDIRKFILNIDNHLVPTYIGIDMENGHYEEFVCTSFEKLSLSDDFFRFDEKQYPDVEVIDLR